MTDEDRELIRNLTKAVNRLTAALERKSESRAHHGAIVNSITGLMSGPFYEAGPNPPPIVQLGRGVPYEEFRKKLMEPIPFERCVPEPD